MLIIEEGDIVTGNYPMFCHQVNCKGVMGAGLAKQIKAAYPEVYLDYRHECKNNKFLIGSKICTTTHDNRICISLFAQEGYGSGKCYTDYQAFKCCLDSLAIELEMLDPEGKDSIAFPYNIGCGLAGGNWNIIEQMLEDFSNKVKTKVIIVKKI